MDAIRLNTAPPIQVPNPVSNIAFYHPGYKANEQSLLFCLAVVDQSEDDPTKWGIVHETALTACRIIAANRCGRLTTDRAGAHVVEAPMHGILTERAYYFAIDDTPESTKYAIVPSFRDWAFPTEGPPAAWAVPGGNYQNTGRCQLTNQVFPERAHLVPRFEREWFARSPLSKRPDAIDHNYNLASLRADLHGLFKRKMFAFVPKRMAPTQSYSFVGHILDSDASVYYTTVQNYTMQEPFLDPEAASHLYARFAWSIIFRTKPFLTAGVARVVSVWDPVDGTTVKEMGGAALQQAYGGGGMRDAAPLKRTWSKRTGDICDDDYYDEDEYSKYDETSQRYGVSYLDGISQTVEADEETGGG